MYSAGLVANETYTLKSEAEVITDAQLQPGTAQTTSVFYAQRTNIKSFEEFKYFTGVTKVLQRTFQGCNTMTSIMLPNSVTELEDYVFQGCSALTDIIFSTSLLKLGSSTFAACSSLVTVILPKGFATIGSNTFIDCPSLESMLIPASTNNIGDNVFMNCGKLHIIVDANNQTFKSVDGVLFNKAGTKLIEYAKETIQPEYEVPEGVTYVGNYAFYNRKGMTYIKFPSTLTRLGNDAISMCSNLKTLRFDGRTAPSLDNESVFGATNATYTGRDTHNTGVNKLYLSQLNATGFEEGLWLDPLQNASKCGFSIHGKLVINTNRTNATFGVSYTAEDGTAHSVTLTSGVSYLDDIKYGTSVTITPRQLTGYTWDSNSVSFTYSATSNSATLNAYVYPANATISGETNPVDNPTYTWTTTTANVDGEYTATWALSGDVTSYMSIASQNNESCTLSITEAPTEEITGTLTLTIKPKVGDSITTTKTLKALLPGVVITTKSNAKVQAALYSAGLVANEKYSLKSELEKVTDISTVFKNKGITTFDEFQYFTAVTSIPDSAFSGNTAMTSLTIPSRVSSIHKYPFGNSTTPQKLNITVVSNNNYYSSVDGVLFNKTKNTLVGFFKGDIISDYTIPSSVYTVENAAFWRSNVSVVRCSNALTLKDSFYSCKNLTKLDFEILNIDTINGLVLCSALTEVTFADGFTTISSNCFNGCKALTKITSNSVVAPKIQSGFWGSGSGGYAGQTNASKGTNRLIIPLNATGYETGQWLSPLQGSSCGFTIHGKITIDSNKPNATFNIAYISEGSVNKTVTVGVGTFYINDVKYGTSMTVTPNTLSGYTWEKASETITYNGTTTVTLNAYVYPSSVTISGDSAIRGGNSATYTATVAPSNVDIGITYTWSLSSSSNASISSSSGNQCTINTQSVETEESLTLTCVATTTDGKKVQKTFAIALQTRPNFIAATYNVTSTSAATQLLYMTQYVTYMEVDGVEVTPVTTYTFTTTGTHSIKITASTAFTLFRGCKDLTKVDFSECDGSKMRNFEGVFYNASNLTDIVWGECTFPNAENLHNCFYNADMLTSVDFTPFAGAKITTIYSIFQDCSKLVSADFSGMDLSKVTSIQNMFKGCSALKSVKFSAFAKVTTAYSAFCNCSSLTSIDLSPLKGCPITDLYSAFYECKALTSIDLSPLNGTIINNLVSAFGRCNSLKSIDLSPIATSAVTSLSGTFSGCSSLTSIDLSPLNGCVITSLNSTFNGCSSLKSIDLNPIATNTVTDLNFTFSECSSLTNIDLSPLDGAKPTNLTNTFKGCSSLTSIDLSPIRATRLVGLAGTFDDCSSLTSIDLSPLSGSVITSLSSIFDGCSSLKSIDLSPIATSKITSLQYSFRGCSSLTSLDLSPFKESTITDLYMTFYGCERLKTIIAPWETAPTSSFNTFGNSTSDYTGRNTYNTRQNILIVPTGATGYDESYWAGVLLDSTKCGFTIRQNGVYIQHTNGVLFTESEWTSSGYSNDQANGVAVLSEECSFVIAKEYTSSNTAEWAKSKTLASGVKTVGSSADAILDFDGYANSTNLNNSSYPAAYNCINYTFPNGKKGYLPAAGEIHTAHNNKLIVDRALDSIGGIAIGDTYNSLWSSTQHNSWGYSYSYVWGEGRAALSSQTNTFEVRAFTTLF